MGHFNIENLRRTSVYITPNFPTLQTKRYKFKFYSLIGYLLIYSFVLMFFVACLFIFTPAGDLLFVIENQKLAEQAEEMNNLETKIFLLTKELSTMASKNQRLKYAMILAGSDSLDSTAAIYDSLRTYEKTVPPSEGNILFIFNRLFPNILQSSADSSHVFFKAPVNGVIVQDFNVEKGHLGIDFGVKEETPIFSATGGTVIFSDYTLNYGYTIIIQHDNNFKSFYKHCSQLLKSEREFVNAGELIALSGNTGNATTGPHLHFEIWYKNKPINPANFILN